MRVAGTSTAGRSMRFALRICVNRSAIESVIMSLDSERVFETCCRPALLFEERLNIAKSSYHSPLTTHHALFNHQLAFMTPGIRPLLARLRKQIRQMPNFRYTARARPQMRHRKRMRILSRGRNFVLAGSFLFASRAFD